MEYFQHGLPEPKILQDASLEVSLFYFPTLTRPKEKGEGGT